MIEQLKKLLSEYGIMEKFAAGKIGVAPATMTNWLSGKTKPALRHEKNIKSYLAIHSSLMQNSEK